MKKRILSLILIASYPFINCEGLYMDKVYRIILKNNGTHSINAYCLREGMYLYPDTSIVDKKGSLKIVPFTTGKFDSWQPWNEEIKKFPKDTLSIFIFHTDTLNKYPWEKIRDEYKILKRYDLSLQDIEKLKYKVPYPPSPEMANMKMYPKYP